MAATGNDDAFKLISDTLKQYGLSSLAGEVRKYLQLGYTTERINIELQDTQAWKKRFAGNEARRQKGLAVLSPSEYLATEAAYRQVMQASGLPPTFYDKPDDFSKWIGTDVSPAEVQRRSQAAQQLVESVDPQVRKEFERFYTKGDMVAYALDQKRTAEILERQVKASQVSAAAVSQNLNVNRAVAERLAGAGVDSAQAQQGFGVVAQAAGRGTVLADVYGTDYGQDDAIDEVFFSDAEATEKRNRLASRERGAFSGQSAVGGSSLGRSTSGRL